MLRKRDMNRTIRNIFLFFFSLILFSTLSVFSQNKNCSELIDSISSLKKQKINIELKYHAINCQEFSCLAIDSLISTNDSITLNQAKIICNLLAQKKCTLSKTFLRCNELILSKEPTFNALYMQANIYAHIDSLNKAYLYYTRAEKISNLSEQKSDCFLGIAKLLEKQKQYEKAKEFAELASELNSLNQESFVFLAELFEKAVSICGLKSEIIQCGVYLLTSKMYNKAGLKDLSEKYKVKSRINELIKLETIKSNQTIKLGCFINKEIELRK
jgi:tetratricopeptide (TPR) repeat protein